MFTKSLLLAALLGLQQDVVANKVFSKQHCFTQMTSPSPKGCISTTSEIETITSTRTVFVTETPVTTVSPPETTDFVTVTSTSTVTVDVDQITDTFTSSVTETLTSTVDLPIETITNTETDTATTTTTVQPTSTIAAPDGFQPVLNTLPGANKRKRSALGSSLLARKEPTCQFSDSPDLEVQSWPASVTCKGSVESLVITTVTRTASIETVTAGTTPATTETSTAIVTSSSLSTTPDASTTVTSTVTLTSITTNSPVTSITTTVTSTSITTSNLPATTEYAICSSDNIASHLNGFQIDEYADRSGGLQGSSTSATTTQDCCNACAANPSCGVAIFYAQSNFCILGVGATSCSANQYSVEAGYNSATTDPEYVVINGNCGAFNVNAGAS
ncbi:hypothetical protein KJ359_005082 [Pestalotiopsis sp. 9143b]|nr:hypothetical protein KJ359_005082 [Pestalotiopsis sp. 9143b]